MKKLFILMSLSVLLFGCADEKTINGITYRPYGLLNEGTCKNDSIHYEVSGFAAVSGVVFSEMFFIPTVYTYGYNLWEPICRKSDLKNTSANGIVD